MSDNKDIKKEIKNETVKAEELHQVTENKQLTAREIFEKISELQVQLAESANHSLFRLDDMLTSICGDSADVDKQVTEVCSVFKMRENTLTNMLCIYEKMYNDLNPENTVKMELVKSAFAEQAAVIKDSDLDSDNKYAALCDVTERLADLTERLLVPPTKESTKEKIAQQIAMILRAKDTTPEAYAHASQLLTCLLDD